MSISSSALLVRLSIGTWTAQVVDRGQTNKVLTDNNAIGNAGQVRKNLMAGTQKSKAISEFAAWCRAENSRMTLPWEDRGDRLLPVSLMLDYKEKFNKYKAQFMQMRGELLLNYDNLKQVSRNYLGDLYNDADYPTADEIEHKYSWQLTFRPVPEAGHFYLDIPASDMEEVRQSLTKENDARLHDATRTAWDRLHLLLTNMTEKLTEAPDGETKRWHGTFVTNASELCAMLTHLNVTGDPALERARQMLEASIAGTNVDMLKRSEQARTTLKSKVDDILQQFEW